MVRRVVHLVLEATCLDSSTIPSRTARDGGTTQPFRHAAGALKVSPFPSFRAELRCTRHRLLFLHGYAARSRSQDSASGRKALRAFAHTIPSTHRFALLQSCSHLSFLGVYHSYTISLIAPKRSIFTEVIYLLCYLLSAGTYIHTCHVIESIHTPSPHVLGPCFHPNPHPSSCRR